VQEGSLAGRSKRGRGRALDAAEFAKIIEENQGAVYGYVRARLLQASDADDLTQEVFLRCYEGWARFDPSAKVRPWLIGIARNLLREYARRTRRLRERAWTDLCLEVESAAPAGAREEDDTMVHLPSCLEALGQSARTAVDLYYGSKMRLAAIGKRMSRSEGAVKLLMFRARQALRHCLDSKTGKHEDD
jgi:RNA polymerase sigma-70 factor (ECF subfamily)